MAHVFEDIAELILARLKDGTYTAPYQLTNFVRPSRLGANFQKEHLLCAVLQDVPQRNPALDLWGNPAAIAWTVPYRVTVFLMPSMLAPIPDALDTVANHVFADVMKVMTTPESSWFNWSNKAVDTAYEPMLIQNDDGSVSAATVTFNVHCRHSENDPTVAR
jgi:hypothetical protein